MAGGEGSLWVVGVKGEVGLWLVRVRVKGSRGGRGLGARISEWGERGLEVGIWGVRGELV